MDSLQKTFQKKALSIKIQQGDSNKIEKIFLAACVVNNPLFPLTAIKKIIYKNKTIFISVNSKAVASELYIIRETLIHSLSKEGFTVSALVIL